MPNRHHKPVSKVTSLIFRRKHLWVVAVASVLLFFLFTPKTYETPCVQNITIYNSINFALNCDTQSIIHRTNDVTRFFTEFYSWRSRPVFVAMGYFLGEALRPIAQPIWWLALNPGAQARHSLISYGLNFHYHLAFMILNIIIVFGCVRGVLHISQIPIINITALALALAVSSIDLVEVGTYMGHTHLYNMIAIVGAALYVSFGMSARYQSNWHVIVLGFLVGIGILCYSIIAILAPAFFMGLIYGRLRWPHLSQPWRALMGKFALFLAALLPLPVSWYLLSKYGFGSMVYLAAERGQFVWMLEPLKQGHITSALYHQIPIFLKALNNTMGPELALCAISLSILATVGRSRFLKICGDPTSYCIFIAILGVLSFNFLQGFYQPRLHISILVMLYIMIARVSYKLKHSHIGTVSLLIITSYQLMNATLYPGVTV